MSSELKLFYETIEDLKSTKLLNLVSEAKAGKDFVLIKNTDLLNPTFYVYEVFGGERLVNEIIFDRIEQKFYIRETDEMLSKSEVIQHVKRQLIQFTVYINPKLIGVVIDEKNEDFRIAREYFQKKACAEGLEILNKIQKLEKTIYTTQLDMYIEIHENTPLNNEEQQELLKKYRGIHEGLLLRSIELFSRLKELNSELGKKHSPISKLIGLFR